jgi:hypothetical protein
MYYLRLSFWVMLSTLYFSHFLHNMISKSVTVGSLSPKFLSNFGLGLFACTLMGASTKVFPPECLAGFLNSV